MSDRQPNMLEELRSGMKEEPITMSMCVNTRDYFERRNEQLKRENQEIRKDKERLDWLLAGDGSMWIDVDNDLQNCRHRDEIDAAMSARKGARDGSARVGIPCHG